MKKPEYEVVKLSNIMCYTSSCPSDCNPDCSAVCPGDCKAECVGYCRTDCSFD